MKTLYQKLNNLFKEEESNYLSWFLYSYIIGVAYYFSSENEPDWRFILLALLTISIACLLCKRLLILFFLILGIFIPSLKAYEINKNLSKFHGEKFYLVEGEIDSILPAEQGYSVIIKAIAKTKFKEKKATIKLRARTKLNGASTGDLVKLKAILYPPSASMMPGGYNFARKAFFEGVSAVGYSVSAFEILEKKQENQLSKYRFQTINTVIKNLGPDIGGMASALMIGEYGSMHRKIMEDFRVAGISHILSVSGMHLSLVAGIFFISLRKLLISTQLAQLRYHSKKISASAAVFFSFIYLAVSGFKVAAVRAFIMSSFFFMAILFSRQILNLRTINMAAIMILLIWPENLVNPSFQMSFLAVFAIIICHQYLSGKSFLIGAPSLIKYFILLSITSLVASIATGLIIALSFNNFSPYSILANFIAVPLTSFYLMPLVVVFFIAQIFAVEEYILNLMKPAIEIIINSAKFVADLPFSKIEIAQLNSLSVYSFILMIIIYYSNHSKIIKYSALAISILIIPFLQIEKPILLSNKNLAIAFIDNKLYSYPKKIPSWSKKNYLAFYGKKEIFFTDAIAKNIDSNLPDNTNMLVYKDGTKRFFCSDCHRPWR